jgi:hypothetical protein
VSYRVDDAEGNAHTAGLSEHDARRIAQRIADRHGETVYLYEAIEGADGARAHRARAGLVITTPALELAGPDLPRGTRM